MNDSYTYIIIALLPLSACMLVFQLNPFHALVIRGILGAVAALVYAVLGAADVALTEALVGTMLSITLYAVAVRSSLIMRLGIIENNDESGKVETSFEQLLNTFRGILGKYYVRLELVPYTNIQALERALFDKEVHATCVPQYYDQVGAPTDEPEYHTKTRIQRLYDIMKTELSSPETTLTYVNVLDSGEKH
ncbi:MAG: DUF4040 domain-containing protein [Cyanobacteriota bacterium]|nr:DUF4040 domain-containing protein [Cyanobacteriota bacterium]